VLEIHWLMVLPSMKLPLDAVALKVTPGGWGRQWKTPLPGVPFQMVFEKQTAP